jgi:hypothetical protein
VTWRVIHDEDLRASSRASDLQELTPPRALEHGNEY